MVMAMNSTAARVHASGADETGLGRWAWLLFEGHNSYRTRVISAYIPCKQQGKKDATVYAQHQRYYNSKGKNGCPRRNMIIELTDQIEKWQRKRWGRVISPCHRRPRRTATLVTICSRPKSAILRSTRTRRSRRIQKSARILSRQSLMSAADARHFSLAFMSERMCPD